MRAVLVLLVAIVSAAPLPLGAAHPVGGQLTGEGDQCGGFAPFVTQCQTGFHVRTLSFQHMVFVGPDYSGVLTSTLEPATGGALPLQTLHCVLVEGRGPCTLEGPDPPRGVPFRQFCESRDLPADAGDPSPAKRGGSGAWFCLARHG